MRVLLEIPLSPFSGYGNDGCGLAQALVKWGADVRILPTVVQPPLPEAVAKLLMKPAESPFDLIIRHLDPAGLEITDEARAATGMAIAWTMWEYSSLGNLPGRSNLKKRIKNFDAIVCYDEVTKGAFAPYFDKPMPIVQGGFWPQDWPKVERNFDDPDHFKFCVVGALHERKDPWVAIGAFTELQNEHPEFAASAELHLKTTVPGLHTRMEDLIHHVRVHYDVWPHEIMQKFYESMHVMISTSRGEGKNMPALEFQSTGGPVIATNWAGHTQWLHPSYSYPLDYMLRSVSNDFPKVFNARADQEHLKELMWHAFTHREEVKRKGDLAAEIIPKMSSWDAVVEKLFLKLKEEVPGGEHLFELAQRCRL